jgi:hypothetical protein
VEGQGALNALKTDCSSSGFGRVRSRPAKILKGAKKAAYCPKTRGLPQSSARRLASPLFLPTAWSYHEVLEVAQLDKAGAARAMTYAARPDEGFCHARSTPPPTHTPHPPISLCARTAPKPVGGAATEERQDASSALGSGEAGDGGMDKATRAAIARTYEVDRGGGGGESGAREGGEGAGGGKVGWLSGLSAAAPEVPPGVESGNVGRGVPGGCKDETPK